MILINFITPPKCKKIQKDRNGIPILYNTPFGNTPYGNNPFNNNSSNNTSLGDTTNRKGNRSELSHIIRKMIFNRDLGLCHYCGRKVKWRKTFTVDHKNPISLGGTDSMENMVCCCRKCNTKKSNLPYATFLTIIQKR